MLWKHLVVLAALAWAASSYAKVVKESLDDAFVQKIERGATSKPSKRGVANSNGDHVAELDAPKEDLQYWNWEESADAPAMELPALEESEAADDSTY